MTNDKRASLVCAYSFWAGFNFGGVLWGGAFLCGEKLWICAPMLALFILNGLAAGHHMNQSSTEGTN